MISPAGLLKLIAPIFFLVGALHLIFGVGADVMLGANLTHSAVSDPVLDSQNRFYGTAFMLYGAVFYISSKDTAKYISVLRSALWIFFASGLARIVSIAIYGLPSGLVLGLLATELVLPPLFLYWYARSES